MTQKIIMNSIILGGIILTVITLTGCTQEVVEQDLTIIADTNTYNGLYTGALEDGKPTGQGKYR